MLEKYVEKILCFTLLVNLYYLDSNSAPMYGVSNNILDPRNCLFGNYSLNTFL